MKVSAQYAQEHFADILTAASNGEDVEIALPDKPAVRLTLVSPAAESRAPESWSTPERPRSELFNSLKGKLKLADDWDSPETNKEIADLFEDSQFQG